MAKSATRYAQTESPLTRKCPRCAGSGNIALPPECCAAFEALTEAGRPLTVDEIRAAVGSTLPQTVARLQRLMDAGHATRSLGPGAKYHYRPTVEK